MRAPSPPPRAAQASCARSRRRNCPVCARKQQGRRPQNYGTKYALGSGQNTPRLSPPRILPFRFLPVSVSANGGGEEGADGDVVASESEARSQSCAPSFILPRSRRRSRGRNRVGTA